MDRCCFFFSASSYLLAISGLIVLDTGCDLSRQRKAADVLYEHTKTLEEQLHSQQAMHEQH